MKSIFAVLLLCMLPLFATAQGFQRFARSRIELSIKGPINPNAITPFLQGGKPWIQDSSVRLEQSTDSSYVWSFDCPMEITLYLRGINGPMSNSDYSLPAYVFPGETLKITAYTTRKQCRIINYSYEGKGEVESRYLAKRYIDTGIDFIPSYLSAPNSTNAKKLALLQKQEQYTREYTQKVEALRPEYLEFLRYSAGFLLDSSMAFSPSLYSNSVHSANYPHFLLLSIDRAVPGMQIFQDPRNPICANVSGEERRKEVLEFCKKQTSGRSRDYALAWMLGVEFADSYQIAYYQKKYLKCIGDTALRAYVADRIAKSQSSGRVALGSVNGLSDANGTAVDFASLKGKVLLLNFWETGSKTCIESMPDQIALAKRFKNKEFALLNICLYSEKNKEEAMALVKEKGLLGENWFADSKASAQLASSFKVRSYPRYVLVDKKGEVRAFVAPSPQKAVAAIKKMLRETK